MSQTYNLNFSTRPERIFRTNLQEKIVLKHLLTPICRGWSDLIPYIWWYCMFYTDESGLD